MCINQSNNRVYLITIMREITVILLLIFEDILIEGELCKELNVKVNFCDTPKLIKTNYDYYKNDNKNSVFMIKTKKQC